MRINIAQRDEDVSLGLAPYRRLVETPDDSVVLVFTVEELKDLRDTIERFLAEVAPKVADALPKLPEVKRCEFVWSKADANGKRKIGIKFPKNMHFIKLLKAATPSVSWNPINLTWWFTPRALDKVEALAKSVFEDSLVRSRLTFTLDRNDSPSIDGTPIMYYGRDNVDWARKDTEGFAIVVVENTVKSGGSKSYPHLSGTCTIEVTHRENAVIVPTPTERKIIAMEK